MSSFTETENQATEVSATGISAAAASAAPPPSWVSTAVPSTGPSRRIRILTGVTESTLDRVPTERSRYTALACVMVGTSLLGGISMLFALSELSGGLQSWCVPLALFWSAFVLLVDRWLVSSMAGSRLRSRLPAALVRLLVATMIGFVIAEPLVLQIFHIAVETQVRTERQQNLDRVQAALVACNPTAGHPAAAAPAGFSCADLRLSVNAPAGDDLAQIGNLKNDESAVQAQIDAIGAKLDQYYQIMRQECDGVSGPGLTGKVGNGPACGKDQQAYSDYRNTHPTGVLISQRDAYMQQIAALQTKVDAETKNTDGQIRTAIQQRLAAETPVDAEIGLVERFNALNHLMTDSSVVAAAAWLLRFFFILIDCLPVLVKLASGATPYDRLVAGELDCAADLHRRELQARRAADDKRVSVELEELSAEWEKRHQAVEFALRRHAAELEVAELAAIDEDYQHRLSAAGFDRLEEFGADGGHGNGSKLNGWRFQFNEAGPAGG